jgi:hypothetical protein
MTARAAAVVAFLIWLGELRRRSQTPVQRRSQSLLRLILNPSLSRLRQTRSRNPTTTMMKTTTMMTGSTTRRSGGMTMTDDLARIAEVLEDSATRATNAVQRQIMTSNAAVVRDAKARIEALTAEREELVECNEQFSVDNHFLKKRAEKAEADNARLKAALTGIKRAAAHRMQNDPKDAHSYYFHTADAALNPGKEPSHG